MNVNEYIKKLRYINYIKKLILLKKNKKTYYKNKINRIYKNKINRLYVNRIVKKQNMD